MALRSVSLVKETSSESSSLMVRELNMVKSGVNLLRGLDLLTRLVHLFLLSGGFTHLNGC